jgi:lipid-binding SYLF domain-containing protein
MSSYLAVIVASSLALFGCASAPKSESGRAALRTDSDRALAEMIATSPDLKGVLDSAAAYAVFPNVGKGGFIVGGAGGDGVLYENGAVTGYAGLSQASIGAQVGGQHFSEVMVLQDQAALAKFKGNKFSVGAGASAVMVKAGAGAAAEFRDGVAIFVHPKGGAMVSASLAGQKVKFTF